MFLFFSLNILYNIAHLYRQRLFRDYWNGRVYSLTIGGLDLLGKITYKSSIWTIYRWIFESQWSEFKFKSRLNTSSDCLRQSSISHLKKLASLLSHSSFALFTYIYRKPFPTKTCISTNDFALHIYYIHNDDVSIVNPSNFWHRSFTKSLDERANELLA